MAYDGLVGVHADGTAPGCTRDRVAALARQLKGRYAVVVNDPQLCALLASLGVKPVYRINRHGWDDDDADAHFQLSAYVTLGHHELSVWEHAYGIPQGTCLLYIGNELGSTQPKRLNAWSLEGIPALDASGRQAVWWNWSVQNPDLSVWWFLEPAIAQIKRRGDFIGFHEGTHWPFKTVQQAIDSQSIGGFIPYMRRYGFKVFISEFAASKSPLEGWDAWLTAPQWVDQVFQAFTLVYDRWKIPVTPFTACPWRNTPDRDTGFDYIDDQVVRAGFARLNGEFTMTNSAPHVTPPTSGGVLATLTKIPQQFINVRDEPNGTQDWGDLLLGDKVRYFPQAINQGWTYVEPVSPVPRPEGRQAASAGWVSLQGGAVVFTPDPGVLAVTPSQLSEMQQAATGIAVAATRLADILEEVASGNSQGF